MFGIAVCDWLAITFNWCVDHNAPIFIKSCEGGAKRKVIVLWSSPKEILVHRIVTLLGRRKEECSGYLNLSSIIIKLHPAYMVLPFITDTCIALYIYI